MTTKALVVEDDPEVMETIEDTLYSMGHEHRWVTNQHDARQALRAERYQYVLLDLQIPAKPNRGGASMEFGVNLLRDIHDMVAPDDVPVVIMTAYSADCLDLSTELASMGASEFISKPFRNRDRSLAKVIRKVVRKRSRSAAKPNTPALKPFTGGDLVFYPDHAELLGVTIISDRGTGQCLMLLRELAKTNSQGEYVHLSGEELATAIGASGVGTITGCVQTLRRNIIKRLGKIGVAVGRDDAIAHDESGYFLREWVRVEESGDRGPSRPSAQEAKAKPQLNERQQWILEQLNKGVALTRQMVEIEFGVGEKTAKRDLADLVRGRNISFDRRGRRGCYQLHVRNSR